MLECFHPASKRNNPSIEFQYLSTPETEKSDLRETYSHFRALADLGLEPQHRTTPDDELPSQEITIESYESFTQLCMFANLLKLGPKNGLFKSCAVVGEGVVRIWRDWLVKGGILWIDEKENLG